MLLRRFLGASLLPLLLIGCQPADSPAPAAEPTVPDWVADATFYQIFPERFRNGDPSNDPTRASLETPVEGRVPETWAISPWTSDWYVQADWEAEMGQFYDGVFDRRYGGDLQGVIDQLDYLAELGINTIYFNPVFYARSMHKYDGNSYHHIDPHFGPDPEGDFALMAQETSDPSTWNWTAADSLFLNLIQEAHTRDIRIIIDGVWNHTGRDFFAFADLAANQQDSPYTDWYIVETFDDPTTPENEFAYKGWWGVETLPEFADTEDGTDLHPGPKQYVFDATARWMDPNGDGDPSDGIDGWRLDVANEVPLQFWADWNAHVRQLNPDAYTVTEIWEGAADFIAQGGFSATMNYHGFSFPAKAYLIDQSIPVSEFATLLNERREENVVAVQYAMQNLMDSHDTDRLASSIVNRNPADHELRQYGYDVQVSPRHAEREGYTYDVRKPNAQEREIQKLVTLFQMTYVGAPMIYYGSEAGMWGADDPDDRMPMVWRDFTYDDHTQNPDGTTRPPETVAFDEDIFAFHQGLLALRTEHGALRRGTFNVLLADDETDLFVYERAHEGRRLVVALNRSTEGQRATVAMDNVDEAQAVQRFVTAEGYGFQTSIEDEALVLAMPALSGVVVEIE
ncbi:MAG: glycoside hydrolase family 13 protein [Bacteroidota bacterium]